MKNKLSTSLTIILFFLIGTISAQEKGLIPIKEESKSGQSYAVVVGISDYQDDNIPDLRYADKDAEIFANYLRSPAGGGLDEDHLKLLTNEKATSGQFASALYWLMEVAQEDDEVIIYFSGHGDVETKAFSQPGYLLCWDAPSRVYMAGGTLAIPMFQIVVSTLSIEKKAKVLLITDACRSGKLSGSEVGGAQITGNHLAKQYANETKILSCQPNEVSLEGLQWGEGRGAFSYHLIEGLMGLADSNEDRSVSLKEIGRYLEDYVSEEVAPHDQNPMIVGNKLDKLSEVNPELLSELREGKKQQLQIFAHTESKGIEEDVLSLVDSTVVEMYFNFKESISDKNFLEPSEACADYYYEKLIQIEELEALHSSMRRNYAAALQDDAQQYLNLMLKSGLTEDILVNVSRYDTYKNYPIYLERAADLLGMDHYMYPVLKARKYFFEGFLKRKRKERIPLFKKALELEKNMPHAMVEIIRNSEADQIDTALYYFNKAVELVPSWVEPYVAYADFYSRRLKDYESAENLLLKANQIDSNSLLVKYRLGRFYKNKKKDYPKAEKWLLKTIDGSGEDICFPCAHLNLANTYMDMGRNEEAIVQGFKALEVDSINLGINHSYCRPCSYVTIGAIYSLDNNRLDEAESQFNKALEYDSLFYMATFNIGIINEKRKQFDLAESYYKKTLDIKPNLDKAIIQLGNLYIELNKHEKAVNIFKEAVEHGSTDLSILNKLGISYLALKSYDEAEATFLQMFKIDSLSEKANGNMGLLYTITERYGEAEKILLRHLERDSSNWVLHANLSLLYQKMEQWKNSQTSISKAINLFPGLPDLNAILGNAYTHIPGRFDEAKSILDEVIELSPASPDTYIYMAQWYLINNEVDQAWIFLEEGLKNGIGNGQLKIKDLETGPDFKEMRKDSRWKELLEKY